MLNTNPETVRRWIRDGKLKATQNSRKNGNIVSEPMLKAFLKTTPKYAAMASAVFSPSVGFATLTATLIGSLLTQQHIDSEKIKNAKVSSAEIKRLIEANIFEREKAIERKKETIQQLHNEIDEEQTVIDHARKLVEEIVIQEFTKIEGAE